ERLRLLRLEPRQALEGELLRVDQVLMVDALEPQLSVRSELAVEAGLGGGVAEASDREVVRDVHGEPVDLAQELVVAHREEVEVEAAVPEKRLIVPADQREAVRPD